MFRNRRRLFGPAGVIAAIAIAFPLGVMAAISFADVPVSHPFYNDIQAIANAGVTTGCGGGNYCPEDSVIRGQMAAFMNRLGALAPDKTPVVNADKLDGLNSTDFIRPNGQILVTAGPGDWVPFVSTDPLTFSHFSDGTEVRRTATGINFVSVHPSIPTALYGKRLCLDAVEFCYTASASAAISYVEINTITHTAGSGARTMRFSDATTRTDAACRLYQLSTPYVLDSEDGVNFFAMVNWSVASAPFNLGRTTFVLSATTSIATAPASIRTPATKGDKETTDSSSAP